MCRVWTNVLHIVFNWSHDCWDLELTPCSTYMACSHHDAISNQQLRTSSGVVTFEMRNGQALQIMNEIIGI